MHTTNVNNAPSYYAVIPANVRYDSRLSPNAKLLYGEITALSNVTGFCYATNKYFADLYGVTNTSISLWVKQLIECGYINSHIEYKEGTKEILKRYLSLVIVPMQIILNTPPQENLKDNNTSNNNTSLIKSGSENKFSTPALFDLPPLEQKKETKKMFKNSACFDIEYCRDKLKKEADLGVDIDYYYGAVADWSERKPGEKCTDRGWIATLRTFMRKDNDAKKLKLVNPSTENTALSDKMKKYLAT